MKFLYSLAFLALILLAPTASGQIKFLPEDKCTPQLGISCPKVLNEAGALTAIRAAITRPLGIVLSFLALLALILIVYAGFRYIWSRGDEKEAEKAKNIILYTVIGLIVIGLAGVIVNVVIRVVFNR